MGLLLYLCLQHIFISGVFVFTVKHLETFQVSNHLKNTYKGAFDVD